MTSIELYTAFSAHSVPPELPSVPDEDNGIPVPDDMPDQHPPVSDPQPDQRPLRC